jgi:hypothetical protein
MFINKSYRSTPKMDDRKESDLTSELTGNHKMQFYFPSVKKIDKTEKFKV